MPVYTIIGETHDGYFPMRYDVVGDTIQDALDTLDEHVTINGGRNLQINVKDEGVVKVRGQFRDENNTMMTITIFEDMPQQ